MASRKGPKKVSAVAATAASHLFAFGVVADIQAADIDDGLSFHGTPRFYRNSQVALQRVVGAWKAQEGLQFGMQLGDIVDGCCKEDGERMLSVIVGELEAWGRPVYHMLGNHCLYNISRDTLHERMGMPRAEDGGSYYAWTPHPKWRFIVVDAYDLSVMGWPPSHPHHQEAVELLRKHNPNENKNSPEGLEGLERRWVQFGGGASKKQVAWLERELLAARGRGERAIVFSHLPFMPGTAPPSCLQWNYEELLDVMRKAGNVVATFAGHAHDNGALRDKHGIYHLVLPAILETPRGRDCYGHVEVSEDGLRLVGVDTMMSLNMPFRTCPPSQLLPLQQLLPLFLLLVVPLVLLPLY